MMDSAVTFACILPALLVAHIVADHWVQTSHQAGHKHLPGRIGRWNCFKHVLSYTVVTAAAVGVLWALFDLQITPAGCAAGQLVSAVTHYWADRRTTLAGLAEDTGNGAFYALGAPRGLQVAVVDDNGVPLLDEHGRPVTATLDNPSLGTGAYVLDQSWHWAWLFVAALLTALA